MKLNQVIKSEEEKNVVTLDFTVEKEAFDAEVTKVFNQKKADITIPGFRKGKAPRALIEKYYGQGFCYDDALEALIPDAFEAALAEADLECVSRPDYEIKAIDENGVNVTAKFFVKPEIEIADYLGIPATRKVEEVTDEQVDAEIKKTQERNGRTEEVTDRAAKLEDTVNIDYEGFKDGVAFEGGKGDGFNLKLGSGQFIPGFEDAVVGHNVGEEFDIDVTFPEEYGAEELAGKPVVFKIKINAIKETILPELDDEFAKDVSEFDTFDEYKASVKAKLVESAEKAADASVDDQVVNALIEKVTEELPASMIEMETENCLRDYDMRLRQSGLDLKTYMQYTGMKLDDLRAQMVPQATNQLKLRLALEKIAVLENIEVSDEELDAEYENIAKEYSVELDDVKSRILPADLKKDLAVQKAVKLVKDSAVVSAE